MVRQLRREGLFFIAVAALVFMPAFLAGQTSGPPTAASLGFPDLVGGLKATPGCLGAEAARTAGGKQVIFAWFENKQAALNWYYSDMHQGVMRRFFPSAPARTPMPDVPDDGQPIMAIASLTMADKPQSGVTSLPVSQIAIELYRPVPGGLAIGGRFAPSSLKVPGMREGTWTDGK